MGVNTFTLPKNIEVGGLTVELRRDKDLIEDHGAMGMTVFDKGRVIIDDSLTGDLEAITYYHELMHLVLTTLGRSELNADEDFVDSVANLLWQAQKTATY